MPTSDIDIKLLRTFVAVARECSFSRAGTSLDLSQATVSVRVGKLEERLGASVFRRGGSSRLRLTSAGCELLPDAEAMLALHERIVSRHRAGNVRKHW